MRLGSFSSSLLHAVAESLGLYRRAGVTVEFQRVTNSRAQFQMLAEGGLDIVLTATDNVVNYRFADGAENFRPLDVRITAGVEGGGALALVARPGITSVGQLRGGRMGVDARDSGFAFALYELLSRAGLQADRDYTVEERGGTPARYRAVLAGACDATMLFAGFDLQAQAAGCGVVVPIVSVAPAYLSTVLAATPRWLDASGEALRFHEAWRRACSFARDPDNRDRCVAILGELSGVGAPLATALYERAVGGEDGYRLDATVPIAGLADVVALRRAHGGAGADVDLHAAAAEPRGLIDHRFTRPV